MSAVTAGGGVAANSYLRESLKKACEKAGLRLVLPEKRYCTDNAAMIGAQGYYEYCSGKRAGQDLNAYATMSLENG